MTEDFDSLPRWYGILATCAALQIGEHEQFEDDWNARAWQNQLRAMLSQDKRTTKFHWTVKRKGNVVTVTKGQPWREDAGRE